MAMPPSRSDQNPSRCWPLGCTSNSSSQQDSTPDAMDAWRVLQRCASRSTAGADRLPRPVRDRVRCLCCSRAGGRRVFDLVSICRCAAPRLDSCASATALTARCSLVWQEASRCWPASTPQPAWSRWSHWCPFNRSCERSVSGRVAGWSLAAQQCLCQCSACACLVLPCGIFFALGTLVDTVGSGDGAAL